MENRDQKTRLTTNAETDQISRNMILWANTFPDMPADIIGGAILYEQLNDEAPCMALSLIQGTNIVSMDILGGYTAEYQFKVIYRIKPGNSMDKRLQADETLNRFGDWARGQTPYIGDGMQVLKIESNSRSVLFDAYESGEEDHQILMSMQYKVAAKL